MDNLEKFFFNRLKKDPQKQQDWNMPSEKSWEALNQNFEKKIIKKRPHFLLWYLVGFLGIALLVSVYSIGILKNELASIENSNNRGQGKLNQEKSTNNEASIQKKDAQIRISESVHSNINANVSRSEVGIRRSLTTRTTELKSTKNHILINITPTITNSKYNFSNQRGIKKTGIANTGMINKRSENNIYPSVMNEVINYKYGGLKRRRENSSINGQNAEDKIFIFNLLPHLAIHNLSLSNGLLTMKKKVFDASNTAKDIDPGLNWAVDIFAAPSWTSIPVKGNKPGTFGKMNGSENLSFSFATGINIGLEVLPKLFVKTGLNFQKINYWTHSIISEGYNKSTEFINLAGEMENIQGFAIPSAMGMLNSKMTITHPVSLQIENGDQVDASVDLHQQLSYLSIPLGMEYYVPMSSKFQLILGGGLSWNHLIKMKNDVEPVVSFNTEKIKLEMSSISNINVSNSVNYYGVLGLNLTIGKKASISIKGNYFRSVSPVFEIDNMVSKIHGINMKIGMSKRF